MSILMFVYLIGGFILLVIGAEVLVRGAARLAARFGISPLIIGLTVVAFGTSAPELAVSVKSAVAGNSGIALGNVIGSNIANIGLILGITALIRPIKIESQMVRRDIPIMIAASLLFWTLLLDGGLSFMDGCILTALLIAYAVEFLQLTNLVRYGMLKEYEWVRIVLGSHFSLQDLVAYSLGAVIALYLDTYILHLKSSKHESSY